MSSELSKEAIELFPGINVANFLTITTGTLEKNDIETIIEVSDKCQENNHLRSVLHVGLPGLPGAYAEVPWQ